MNVIYVAESTAAVNSVNCWIGCSNVVKIIEDTSICDLVVIIQFK